MKGQEIYGPFDDQRDEYLEKVGEKHEHEAEYQGPAVLNKVFLEGQEILNGVESLECKFVHAGKIQEPVMMCQC